MAGSRRAFVNVSYVVLAEMLMSQEPRHHEFIRSTNFPKDARIVRVADPMTINLPPKDVIRVVFESDTLPEVPEGAVIPEFVFRAEIVHVAPTWGGGYVQ